MKIVWMLFQIWGLMLEQTMVQFFLLGLSVIQAASEFVGGGVKGDKN